MRHILRTSPNHYHHFYPPFQMWYIWLEILLCSNLLIFSYSHWTMSQEDFDLYSGFLLSTFTDPWVSVFKNGSSKIFTWSILEYIVPCDNVFLQEIGEYISYSTKQIKCEVGIMESFKLDEIRANISRIWGFLRDNWKPSFLPFLILNCRTFSRQITVRWWRQWAKNQVLTNQNLRNMWCQIVRRIIWYTLITEYFKNCFQILLLVLVKFKQIS